MRPSCDTHREGEVGLAPQGLSRRGVGPDWRSSLRPAWGLCSDQGGSEVAWPCPGSTALPTLAPHPRWLQSAPSTCHSLSQGDLQNDEGQGSSAAPLWGLPSAEAPELCTVALGLSSRYRSPHTRAPPSLLFPSPDFLPATPPRLPVPPPLPMWGGHIRKWKWLLWQRQLGCNEDYLGCGLRKDRAGPQTPGRLFPGGHLLSLLSTISC